MGILRLPLSRGTTKDGDQATSYGKGTVRWPLSLRRGSAGATGKDCRGRRSGGWASSKIHQDVTSAALYVPPYRDIWPSSAFEAILVSPAQFPTAVSVGTARLYGPISRPAT